LVQPIPNALFFLPQAVDNVKKNISPTPLCLLKKQQKTPAADVIG
jgi:hypothetical protein